ncbi:MAG: hydrogenase subunit MbhD domain-containing protein, partial [Methylococcales bacterium]
MTEFLINAILLFYLAVLAVAIYRIDNLFAATMLMGIYSLLCAATFVVMDAVDVAFTEAAVGAGISTILILTALSLSGYREEDKPD